MERNSGQSPEIDASKPSEPVAGYQITWNTEIGSLQAFSDGFADGFSRGWQECWEYCTHTQAKLDSDKESGGEK